MVYAIGNFCGLGLIFAIGALTVQEWLIGGTLLLLTLLVYLLFKDSVKGFLLLL
jgi:hypothetical protein